MDAHGARYRWEWWAVEAPRVYETDPKMGAV